MNGTGRARPTPGDSVSHFDWTKIPGLIESLPVNGGFDMLTDRVTGLSVRIRRSQRFLVTDDDTYCVTDQRTSETWRIGIDQDGEYWKERLC